MTVVLPAAVASFRARRGRPGLASSLAFCRCSRNFSPRLPSLGATSVSQIAVSTASSWQKKGRIPLNSWCRQCCSKRAVSGVTFQFLGSGRLRHAVIVLRSSLMRVASSYSCSLVARALAVASSRSVPCCAVRFFGLGMGVMKLAGRRESRIFCVGCRSRQAPSAFPAGYRESSESGDRKRGYSLLIPQRVENRGWKGKTC